MYNTDRYNLLLDEELAELEEDGKLPHGHKTSFIHGYKIAASFWHQQGLIEGWNDHIKKLSQLMEPLGGEGDV